MARQWARQKHAAAWGSGATLLQSSSDKESSFPAPLHCSAVRWGVLRSLVSMAQEMLSTLWEDRLLRHLTAQLQRYYRACMKCNISASINGWHLDGSSTDALTLRPAFCKALSPSSRMEGRDCSGLKKKKRYQQTKILSTQPATQRCCEWILFWGQEEAHTRNRKMLYKVCI